MNKRKVETLLTTVWENFLPENIVLVQAAGLCPVLAVATDLKTAVALSVCTAVTMIPVGVILTLLSNKIVGWLRPALYALASGVLLTLCGLVMLFAGMAEIYAKLYIFLPLMAVNTLLTYRGGGSHRGWMRPAVAIAQTLGSAAGFALVMCVTGALREMAINGSLWNIPLGYAARFPEAEHPFIGFVLLGFMAATLQWVKQLCHRVFGAKEEEV